MISFQSAQDFATVLLCGSNAVERCSLEVRVLKGPGLSSAGYNNKTAQLSQVHRAMHHRSHQTEY